MRFTYTFDLTIEVDDPVADESGLSPSPEWKAAVSETCREFGDQLSAFLERHPLVRASKITEKKV